MRREIWKFPFEINDRVVVPMPEGAKVLKIETQNDIPCMWALVDPEAPRKRQRVFYVFGTGRLISDPDLEWLATFQDRGFVWHVFQRKHDR